MFRTSHDCWCQIGGALISALCAVCPPLHADAAGIAPETLAVVVNTADPVSVGAAEYYVARRNVPRDNVISVHIDPVRPTLGPGQYEDVKREVLEHTPAHVQAYLLTWAQPFRTSCMSITTAFASGFDDAYCTEGCMLGKASPYFDSNSARPYDELKWRPTMSLTAADLATAKALVDRGIAADGTAPPGTGYLLRTSDPRRNVRAPKFPSIVEDLGRSVELRYVEADFIEGRDDVLFYFTGTSEVQKLSSNHFRPGAIADHLTSGGG